MHGDAERSLKSSDASWSRGVQLAATAPSTNVRSIMARLAVRALWTVLERR